MDLCHECAINQPSGVEDLLWLPVWISGDEGIADGVVFEDEDGADKLQAQPPIAVETSLWDAILIARQENGKLLLVNEELPVRCSMA
jgi:hypothetical protein